MKALISLFVLCITVSAFAAEEHKHTPVKVTPEFESMKALVGTWQGKGKMDGKEMDMKVTYELTSGGTALVEKMNPGTPMEMVTIYANSGKTVNATHYCAMGNQPQMALKQAKGGTFTFEMNMTASTGLSDKNETHMHAVTLTLNGNKLKQDWTNFEKGKKGGAHTFEFTKQM